MIRLSQYEEDYYGTNTYYTYYYTTPLGVVIAIIFGGFLVTVGGLTGIKRWFEENLYSFALSNA